MPLTRKFDDEELTFGLVLQDQYLFALLFWSDDLRLPTTVEQRMMLTDESPKQIWATARKILKTLSLERDVMFAIVEHYKRTDTSLWESMFTTPRDSHLVPTRDRLYSKIDNTPFFKRLIKDKNKSGGGAGILESHNGYKWHFRIEGISGLDENMAGIRARKIIGDEEAFGNWACYNSRIMTKYPDAPIKYCGVPNGVRDTPFYQLDTDPEMNHGWSHHKYPSFVNPIYQDPKMQDELARAYGGKHTQGYINNVLGEWGEPAYASFPPGSIAVDKDMPVSLVELQEGMVLEHLHNIQAILAIPQVEADDVILGLDFGYSPDPTEIIPAYRKGDGPWRQLARIRLVKVKLPTQTRLVHAICSQLFKGKVRRISTDNVDIIQTLTDKSQYGTIYEDVVHFANPGGSSEIIGLDGQVMLDESGHPIKKRNKQLYTDEIKAVFQNTIVGAQYHRYLRLGNDQFLLDALTGMVERKTENFNIVYECSKPEEEHAVDALRYLMAGIMSYTKPGSSKDLSEYFKVMGWAGEPNNWKAPWDRQSPQPERRSAILDSIRERY